MIGTVFYNIIFKPLEMIMEIVFSFVYRLGDNTVLALLGVSLAVGFLTLPLYKRADEIQKDEREKQKSMEYWVDHIKSTFKGDERYFMLTTYYRQQNYHPIYALRSSFSLLLQIPFFVAAYNYLSNLQLLKESSFWIINNLGAPDQLLSLGNWKINVLPIIMTLINLVSAYIYTKDLKFKDKIQPLILAGLFLVLLYNSPSGLVLYWIFNQCFSVIKNIVFSSKKTINEKREISKANWISILVPEVGLFILLGLVIPLSAIVSAPLDFVSRNSGPNQLLLNTASVYFGLFLVWANIIIYFTNEKGNKVYDILLNAAFLIAVADFFLFSKKLGIMSEYFVFDEMPKYTSSEKVINLLIIVIIIIIMVFLMRKSQKAISIIIGIITIGLVCLSVINTVNVNSTIAKSEYSNISDDEKPIFNLSKNKENVVIIMLDKAVGPLVPYIFRDVPSLSEVYSGFTYYPNTVSFAQHTIYAVPALFGGYEYTPEAMNKRDQELLKDKHNEAVSVLPTIFSKANAEITVCDMPYVNYKSNDLSIYDNIPNVRAFNTMGNYGIDTIEEIIPGVRDLKFKNAQYYSLFRVAPLIVQRLIYHGGMYFNEDSNPTKDLTEEFLDSYMVLSNFPKYTKYDNDKVTLTIIDNETPHRPVLLDASNYKPEGDKDYLGNKPERFAPINHEFIMETAQQLANYDVNAASLLRVGEWLECLKKNGVYDNTRIIVVSDHGNWLKNFDELIIDDSFDAEGYAPLLLVKDFNAKGKLTISEEFMTNADVPFLAVQDIIENPINPFTGNVISIDDKKQKKQYVTGAHKWHTGQNSGTKYDTSDGNWYSIHDYIWEKSNWECVGEEIPKNE